MLIKPYYEDDSVTLYCGAMEKVLPQIDLSAVGLCLTDPPYGINYKHSGNGSPVVGRKEGAAKRHGEKIIGDSIPFDPIHLLKFNELILWGANNYIHRLPERIGRWLIWDKADGRYEVDSFGDAELAWHNKGKANRIFRYAWKGVYCVKAGEDNGRRLHPTMKPIGLMRWCIGQAKSGGMIIDPYAGSGTTLVAAKLLKRRAIGIEISEQYCKVIVSRLNKPMPLFEQQKDEDLFAVNAS